MITWTLLELNKKLLEKQEVQGNFMNINKTVNISSAEDSD